MKKYFSTIWSDTFSYISLAFYGLLIITAAFFIRNLQVAGGIDENLLPSAHAYSQKTSLWHNEFPVQQAAIINIAFDEAGPFDQENLQKVKLLTENLLQNTLIKEVYSITSLDDSGPDSFTEEPFMNIQDLTSLIKAERTIQEIQVLKSLFLSSDNQALLLYVVIEDSSSAQEFGRYFDEFRAEWKISGINLSIAAPLYYEYQNRNLIIQELIQICAGAFFILLIIYFIFTGSPSASLVFLVNSLIPSFILFGFLTFSGKPIDIMTIFLPLLLFSITTAYSIHYFKTRELLGSRKLTLQSIGTVIMLSAFTTIIGYTNLLFIEGDSIRRLGTSLIIGIMLAVFSILWCVPMLVEKIPSGKLRRWELRLRSTNFPTGKSGRIIVSVFIGILLFSLGGLYWYGPSWHFKDGFEREFQPWVAIRQEEELFAENNGFIREIDVFIDTGIEYGLIELEIYHIVEELANEIRSLDTPARVISYTDITAYGNGILYGEHRENPPQSEVEIGETLELVSSYRSDIPLDLFVDISFRKTRLIVRYDSSSATNSHQSYLLDKKIADTIEALLSTDTRLDVHLSGLPILQKELINYYIGMVAKASTYFFLLVAAIGFLVLRSIRKCLLLVLPSFLAMLFYAGINGWLRQPISVYNIFGLYTLLGISVDDTFYFLIHHRREERSYKGPSPYAVVTMVYRRTGINILETTLIISGGIAAALTSGVMPIFNTILVTLLALNFSTAVTLFIMPRFLFREGSTELPPAL
jgi:uncharacterized protein